ncbi:MAG: hypothetical protein IJ559_04010 [Prevotella sp.]|nr:hypothetical protein [Prevotella sp.]
MRKIFITFMMALLAVGVFAQKTSPSLIVYDVSGKVTNVKQSKETPVEKKQYFSLTDMIKIPENGFIKLLDKEKQKMYTLRNKCQGKISALIESQKDAGKNLTKQYFAYVLRSLTRSDTDVIYNTGHTTGTYRNDADSLLCDIDSLQTVVDSLQNVISTLVNDSTRKP